MRCAQIEWNRIIDEPLASLVEGNRIIDEPLASLVEGF